MLLESFFDTLIRQLGDLEVFGLKTWKRRHDRLMIIR